MLLLECGAEVAIYALGQGSLFKLEQGSPQTAAPSKRHGHNLGHSKKKCLEQSHLRRKNNEAVVRSNGRSREDSGDKWLNAVLGSGD